MIRHQAVAIERQRIAALCLSQGVQKGQEVGWRLENGGAIIAPVKGMIHQSVGDRSREARHAGTLAAVGGPGKEKMN
jgi:hypothetical protein